MVDVHPRQQVANQRVRAYRRLQRIHAHPASREGGGSRELVAHQGIEPGFHGWPVAHLDRLTKSADVHAVHRCGIDAVPAAERQQRVDRSVGEAAGGISLQRRLDERPATSERVDEARRLRPGRQHPAHPPGAGENAGRSRESGRGELCSDHARVGGACAVERGVGHGPVDLVLPEAGRGGAGMPQRSGDRVRSEAHCARGRGGGAEGVAGPGSVKPVGVVLRPEGARYPYRDLAAGQDRGKEVGTRRAPSLRGGERGSDDHAPGVDGPRVERIVERVHAAVERVHERCGRSGERGGAADDRRLRDAAGFREQAADRRGGGRGTSRAHDAHGVEDMIAHLAGDGRGHVRPPQTGDEGREAPFGTHGHAAGRVRQGHLSAEGG